MTEQSIPNREIVLYLSFITRFINSMISCLDGLSEEDLNWRPPIENANSLYVLPVHMMGNLEEVVLGLLCGQPTIKRQRENEFKATGDSSEPIKCQWEQLQEKLISSLAQLPADALDREYTHPRRGQITGRGILTLVAVHAAEHNGQAKITRDMLFTARGRPIPYREY